MQTDLFDISEDKKIWDNYDKMMGEKLRDEGMKKAIDHANRIEEKWSDMAYNCLIRYVRTKKTGDEFLAEDFRKWAMSQTPLPRPPNLRAYGAIMMRAKKNNIVSSRGTRPVSDPGSHKANANLWVVV